MKFLFFTISFGVEFITTFIFLHILFVFQLICANVTKLFKFIYFPLTILLIMDLIIKIYYFYIKTFMKNVYTHKFLSMWFSNLYDTSPIFILFFSIFINILILIILYGLMTIPEKKSLLFKVNHKNNIIILTIIYKINFYAYLFYLFSEAFKNYLPLSLSTISLITGYIFLFNAIFSIGFFINNIINWIKRRN